MRVGIGIGDVVGPSQKSITNESQLNLDDRFMLARVDPPKGPAQKLLAIITADHDDLRGCDADGRRLARCLADYEPRWCAGATRAKVFALFRALRRELRPGASLVIYLSGHGGRAQFRGELGPGLPAQPDWPFFVTADQSSGSVFVSLLAVELSMLVGTCLAATSNIVVIVDTCFAPRLVRASLRLKSTGIHEFDVPTRLTADYEAHAIASPWSPGVAVRLASLLDSHVVCVNATGDEQSAYEVETADHRASGAFSSELIAELPGARARRDCWDRLVSIVDRRLGERWGPGFQRPVVTGPGGRRVFELDTVELPASARVSLGPGGSIWLESGRLHGTGRGDVFAAAATPEATSLEVVDVGDERARVTCDGPTPPDGTLVWPRRRGRELAVAVALDCGARPELLAGLERSPRLRLCQVGDRAELRVGGRADALEVRARTGELRVVSDAARVLDDLEALARAQLFEELWTELAAPDWIPEWSFCVVRLRGRQQALIGDLDRVCVGDRLWIELANHSQRELPRLHVNLVETGLDGRLRVLNRSQYPNGVTLSAGSRRRLSWYPEGPRGRAVVWPDRVPSDAPRTLVWSLVVTPVPVDLRVWASGADIPRYPSSPRGLGSPPRAARRRIRLIVAPAGAETHRGTALRIGATPD